MAKITGRLQRVTEGGYSHVLASALSFWTVLSHKCDIPSFQRRRDDNKNNIFAFGGGGPGGRGGKSSKNAVFFVGNATTIIFWKRKFYCREILLSLRRFLSLLKHDKIVRGNRLPVQCQHVAWQHHSTLVPFATQKMSMPLVCLPPVWTCRKLAKICYKRRAWFHG